VCYLGASWTRSERNACGLVGISRSSCRYRGSGRDDGPLKDRLRELAGERRRFGYRRLHVLLCREGWTVSHNRTPSGSIPAYSRRRESLLRTGVR